MTYHLDEATELLAVTPATLTALLGNLSEPWLTVTEGPDTWSAVDIVGHLIHGEEADWLPRARHLLDHGESRPWEPFDPYAMFTKFAGWSMPQLLERFAAARRDGLATLASWELSAADLERTTRHPDFGRVTLGQHLATWVAHDLGHVAQISRVMARRYAADVGPWSKYLRIVRPFDNA